MATNQHSKISKKPNRFLRHRNLQVNGILNTKNVVATKDTVNMKQKQIIDENGRHTIKIWYIQPNG